MSLVVYLSFVADTDFIMTLVQYFICCITHFLSVMK